MNLYDDYPAKEKTWLERLRAAEDKWATVLDKVPNAEHEYQVINRLKVQAYFDMRKAWKEMLKQLTPDMQRRVTEQSKADVKNAEAVLQEAMKAENEAWPLARDAKDEATMRLMRSSFERARASVKTAEKALKWAQDKVLMLKKPWKSVLHYRLLGKLNQ